MRHRAVFAFVCVASLPAAAAAQGTIRGVVIDSLRGTSPIAGARITLEGTSMSAETDRRGRFAFNRVAPGTYRLVWAGARFDTVGTAPEMREVTLSAREEVEVRLATPSAATLQQRYCGTAIPATGVLRGVISGADGAPRAGAEVAAIWDEAVLDHGNLAVESRASVDTAAADGSFSVCGVPLTRQVILRSLAGAERGGDLVVAMEGEIVVRRDVRVSPESETTIVTGRVRSRRRGVATAVEIWGDTLRSVATDSTGRFRFPGVPRRSGQLYIRAIGQQPRLVPIEPTEPTLDVGEIVLEDAAVALQPMTIRERQLTRERLAFEERSRGAVGVFFDSTYLAQLPRVTAAALAAKNTLIRVGPNRSMESTTGETVMLRSVNSAMNLNTGCYPRVFINGVGTSTQEPRRTASGGIASAISPEYMKELFRTARRIEVYQATFAPVEFHDPDGCGSIVIWTR